MCQSKLFVNHVLFVYDIMIVIAATVAAGDTLPVSELIYFDAAKVAFQHLNLHTETFEPSLNLCDVIKCLLNAVYKH